MAHIIRYNHNSNLTLCVNLHYCVLYFQNVCVSTNYIPLLYAVELIIFEFSLTYILVEWIFVHQCYKWYFCYLYGNAWQCNWVCHVQCTNVLLCRICSRFGCTHNTCDTFLKLLSSMFHHKQLDDVSFDVQPCTIASLSK